MQCAVGTRNPETNVYTPRFIALPCFRLPNSISHLAQQSATYNAHTSTRIETAVYTMSGRSTAYYPSCRDLTYPHSALYCKVVLKSCSLVGRWLLALGRHIKVFRVSFACLEVLENHWHHVLGHITLQNSWDIRSSRSHTKRNSHPSSLCEVMWQKSDEHKGQTYHTSSVPMHAHSHRTPKRHMWYAAPQPDQRI